MDQRKEELTSALESEETEQTNQEEEKSSDAQPAEKIDQYDQAMYDKEAKWVKESEKEDKSTS